jgi:predicted Fe-Mo cluster-binding NifX family protein
MVHDTDTGSWTPLDNIQNLHAAQGAGIQAASLVVNNKCSVLISGHCGPKAFSALSRAGVAVYAVAGGSVGDALSAWQEGSLRRITEATVEGHW